MIPPTSIDGTDITGATIDGTDVTEITVDGDTVFTSVFEIPDSAVAHFNAQNLSGFSDGNTVTTWPEEVSGSDATGTATYRPSAINGHPALEFNGSSDEFSATLGTFSQPNTIFAVVDLVTLKDAIVVSERQPNDTNRNNVEYDVDNSRWSIFAGDGLSGADDQGVVLLSTKFDGSNSVLRQNGTQTASGFAGSEALDALAIGYLPILNGRYFDGYIGFIEIHDGTPTNGLTAREQEIANLWDITI